jgi:hypothetical protein
MTLARLFYNEMWNNCCEGGGGGGGAFCITVKGHALYQTNIFRIMVGAKP